MQLVIPLQAMRRALRERMESHARTHHYDECGTLTEERLVQLLTMLIEDSITARLKHSEAEPLTPDFLTKLFPFWSEEVREAFRYQVVDEVEVELTKFLVDYLPKYEWRIWSSQQIGFDLLLIIGEDFRIKDWTRRMASGEWNANN